MQWLIDLILSLIPSGPGYIDRGDATTFDFELTDLITDNTWRTLDLSAVIPENTTAVHLRVFLLSPYNIGRIRFRKLGHTGFANIADADVQLSNQSLPSDKIVSVSESRQIQYRAANTTYTSIFITVAGWFGPES